MSEKDGKIGMCVVVHAAVVGRCQRDNRVGISYRDLWESTKWRELCHGHEGATRLTRLVLDGAKVAL